MTPVVPQKSPISNIKLLPPQKEFLFNNTTYSLFSGGFGCVAGETKIFNPILGIETSIEDINLSYVSTYFENKLHISGATKPKQYKRKNLYKVRTDRGLEIIVTRQHKFLTLSGWKHLSELKPSESLVVSGGFHPLTILELFRSVRLLNVRSFLKIAEI